MKATGHRRQPFVTGHVQRSPAESLTQDVDHESSINGFRSPRSIHAHLHLASFFYLFLVFLPRHSAFSSPLMPSPSPCHSAKEKTHHPAGAKRALRKADHAAQELLNSETKITSNRQIREWAGGLGACSPECKQSLGHCGLSEPPSTFPHHPSMI